MKLDPVFDLERSRWYAGMKCALACDGVKIEASHVLKWSRIMQSHGYEPVTGSKLAEAETALTEALFAVKVAREEYENNAGRVLAEAAE